MIVLYAKKTREALSFIMRDYNYSCSLGSCQSIAIYYSYNHISLEFLCTFFSNACQGFKLLVCYNHIQYYIDMLSFTIKLCLYPWKIAWSQSHWTPIPNREILLVAFNTQKTCGYYSMVFLNETHETYFNMWTTSMRMKICGFRPTTWMNSDKWWMSNKTISSSTSRS